MRTRRNVVLGVAGAVLAVTACGAAVSNSGGTPGVHVAQVAARDPFPGAQITGLADLAGVKRHITWVAGDRARVQRPQEDAPGFVAWRDLVQAKLSMFHAAQQP